jgi:hypothetical protein
MKKILIIGLLIILLSALSGCAPGPNEFEGVPATSGQVAGFWLGLWHGAIAPVTFVISLFNSNVSMYDVHNTGGWYNFGFLFGLSVVWGGGSRGAAAARRSRGS